MGHHYLIFMVRNIENKKKLTSLRIMYSVAMDSIFSENTEMNNVSCEYCQDEE
jgi:hypothetical protein